MFEFLKPKAKKPRTPYKPKPYVPPEFKPPKPYEPKPKPQPEPSVKPEIKPPAPKQKPEPKKQWDKEFLRVFKQLTCRHNPWNVWQDYILMTACAISNALDKSHYEYREDLYLKTIARYSKDEQALFPELLAYTTMALDENQEQDFLGKIFMNLDLGNDAKGQIFTPYHICELMAKTTLTDAVEQVKEQGYITINDPACGAGATLIAGIAEAKEQLEKAGLNYQNHVLIFAQDIDMTVGLMCYIQISLLGVAGMVKIGNTLTEPMCSGDKLDNYWFTPVYFTDTWTLRRTFQSIGKEIEK